MKERKVGYSLDERTAEAFSAENENLSRIGRVLESLASGKSFSISVTDKSLMPFIRPGDMMHFAMASYEHLNAGAFVLYRGRTSPTVKRVIRKAFHAGRAVIYAKTDISKKAPEQVPMSSVIAVLTHITRQGQDVQARTLNRGLIDKMTDFGTRTPSQKLISMCHVVLPPSMRPNPDNAKTAEPVRSVLDDFEV